MASISKDKNGTKRLVFNDHNGKRHFVRLGKVYAKDADLLKSRVTAITSAKIMGVALDAETAAWLVKLGDDLHAKLAKTGIIDARDSRTLKTFLEAYAEERSDLKPRTRQKNETSIKSIVGFFGDIPLRSVTHEQAELYRVSLVKSGYSEATLSKMIEIARMFFNVAKRRKLIDDNPFEFVETGRKDNKEHYYEVTREETERLLDACGSAKDRLKIALARFAGLRVPSELTGLRWSEVNLETGRFTVHSPKTERKGKAKRIVPIFDMPNFPLRKYFDEAFETAPEGEDRIFPEITEKKSMGSWIEKLANRAGVALWTKPFQNMRATVANELFGRKVSPSRLQRMAGTYRTGGKQELQAGYGGTFSESNRNRLH